MSDTVLYGSSPAVPRRWSRIAADRRGAAYLVFALAAPVLVGSVGLGVETGLWYVVKREAQTAADAGALSGAVEALRGTEAATITAARREAARNGFAEGTGTTVVANRSVDAQGRTRVEVVVTREQPPLFTALFLNRPVPISARAAAVVEPRGEACVLALDTTGQAAVSFGGSPVAMMGGCVVAANSSAANAIDIAGNSEIQADALWTVGGIDEGGSTSVTLSSGKIAGGWPLPDPYADRDLTAPSGCTYSSTVRVQGPETLSPGTICGDVIVNSNGVLILTPGTYYLKNGDLTISAQGTVRCDCPDPTDGVTIILSGTDPGSVDVRGGAEINLRAPSAEGHPWRGILIAQAPNARLNASNKMNGGATMNVAGALYFPSQPLEFAGNNSASVGSCTKLVAKQVSFHGDSSLANGGCKGMGADTIPTRIARLVE